MIQNNYLKNYKLSQLLPTFVEILRRWKMASWIMQISTIFMKPYFRTPDSILVICVYTHQNLKRLNKCCAILFKET